MSSYVNITWNFGTVSTEKNMFIKEFSINPHGSTGVSGHWCLPRIHLS